MNVEELKSLVGKKYRALDKDGSYIGCFEPMYALHPELPRFKLPDNELEYFDYSFNKIKEFFEEITLQELKPKDLIITKLPKNILHIAIYLGNNQILQTLKNNSLQINRFNKDHKRIMGFYRKKEK